MRAGSKPAGSATKLWMRAPRELLNQNSWTGCQSMAAARSVLNDDSTMRAPLAASIRTSSGGFTALSHVPASVVPRRAPSSAPIVPAVSVPTSRTAPPAIGIAKSFCRPCSSASRKIARPSPPTTKVATERSNPSVSTRLDAGLPAGPPGAAQSKATSRVRL